MLQLYHASHSTCSQKVRIVLHEKGLTFEDIRLDLAKKEQLEPHYLVLNPNGVVPTLVDDGEPVVDSSVICEYLDEKYPQNPLAPSGLIQRANMRSWMRYLEEVPTTAIRMPSFNRAFLYRFDGLDQKRSRTSRSTCAPSARNSSNAWGRRTAFRKAKSTAPSSNSPRPANA